MTCYIHAWSITMGGFEFFFVRKFKDIETISTTHTKIESWYLLALSPLNLHPWVREFLHIIWLSPLIKNINETTMFSTWINFIKPSITKLFNVHCGCTPRVVRGVTEPEILREIQKYSLAGRPSSQNWVKSKTIRRFIKIP